MTDRNGHDIDDDGPEAPSGAQAMGEANIPTLSIKDTLAHGADPLGDEAAVIIGSITGQHVRLHFPTLEAAADFFAGVRATLNQMRQNARAAGKEVMAASPVAQVSVGHVNGTPGTMMVLDPGTPFEAPYLLSNESAVELGKLLVVEAGKRIRIDDAIRGGTALTVPKKPRIIRPGEH